MALDVSYEGGYEVPKAKTVWVGTGLKMIAG